MNPYNQVECIEVSESTTYVISNLSKAVEFSRNDAVLPIYTA